MRCGRGGRGARHDTPNPQVQDIDPVEQEEVQVNQDEFPIMQGAGANVAEAPTPVVVAPVLPNEARNQVPVISSCKFKLHTYINDARFANRIFENRTLRFGYSKHETKRAYVFCIIRKVSCFPERSCLIFKVCFAIRVRKIWYSVMSMTRESVIFCHVYGEESDEIGMISAMSMARE